MIMWLIMAPGLFATFLLFWMLIDGTNLSAALAAGIVLCVVLFMALLYSKTRWYAAAITIILPLVLIVALQPVCRPMDEYIIAGLNPPIGMRADRDLYMDVFQQRPDGGWNQCRTQLARWFDF